ncbi:cell wall synthesis protein CwsA [Mycolicibacterium agri]|uniref:Cell wall synthesis protein CwsA n=1 Tax=Mycolicibacterium agri TaxID=36811 RepID=A0A2A7N4I5_MYCAG|nr:cell wall synthesis protein CwsA [Mycolicibacterium agri]PEG38760.1 cell wall synthesis protein CwsA [Mycolicibacterium agri]GFG53390.1 cell wall synthesis protein CwsA [Mycolicibacterium agri]
MGTKTDERLTPGQRLTRGLKYTAVGPVDVTLGTVGLGWRGANSAASSVRERLEKSRLAREVAKEVAEAGDTLSQEIAAAQEVLANLPQALADARKPKRRPRPLLLITAGAVVLGVGAVAFSIVRRSMQPDPSPRPPSVEVTPRP